MKDGDDIPDYVTAPYDIVLIMPTQKTTLTSLQTFAKIMGLVSPIRIEAGSFKY
jgi:hypothetical protein